MLVDLVQPVSEMNLELYPTQIDAINRMHNGCILDGGTGSGKSRAGIAYVYLKELKGSLKINGQGKWLKPKNPKDLYIITTPKKRDSKEWEEELNPFGLSTNEKYCLAGIDVTVDSWNNIRKYTKVYNQVFIFDEDKAISHNSGAWSKAFLDIARKNHWIMLSATSGDVWMDYMYVFIANGFYKNKTEFKMNHVVYKPYMNYPVIDHYINQGILTKHRRDTLVHLDSQRKIERKKFKATCDYSKELYKKIWKDRWNPFDNEPIEETGKLFYLMRKCVNTDPSRIEKIKEILKEHPKSIIFYNFSPELYLLRDNLIKWNYPFSEWNGEKHEPIPTGDKWVYLVQYTAGAEGWNCTTTDTIIFYSLSYSYKQTVQAEGRIDRSNTPFKLLYYYYLSSYSPIDLAIQRSLKLKRNFNERRFLNQ